MPKMCGAWGTHAGKRRERRRRGLLIEYGAVREGSTVLGLGCGTGIFTKYLTETGATVTALDLSWDLLVQVNGVHGRRVRRILGDAESLPFADSSFDAVVGSSILHHLDVPWALHEVLRVLRPGGRIEFCEPNMLNLQIAVQKNVPFIKRMLGDSPDQRAFIRWRSIALVREVGFDDVKVFPYNSLHALVPPMHKPVAEIFSDLPHTGAGGSLVEDGDGLQREEHLCVE